MFKGDKINRGDCLYYAYNREKVVVLAILYLFVPRRVAVIDFTKAKLKIQRFKKNWINGNIFKYNKVDGGAYLFFYVLIPIIVTVVSLNVSETDYTAIAYCYLSILISAFNCLYDSANRWNAEQSTVNVKLFCMMLANVIIVGYCLVVIFWVLVLSDTTCRMDAILYVYLFSVAISVGDIIACYSKDMALYSCLEGDD